MSGLQTTGQIADDLHEPRARVNYIIDKYRIKAVQRVGIIRLFNAEQKQEIKDCLFGIQIRKSI